MSDRLQNEKNFLIMTAVRQFNSQYRRNIDHRFCGIRSIRGNYGCHYGYEIKTIRGDDYLRLRFYFNLGECDRFEPYRLETDVTFKQQALGDEVYVMLGTVDHHYVDSGLYRFRKITGELVDEDYVLFMSGEFFEFMTGEKMTYVSSV